MKDNITLRELFAMLPKTDGERVPGKVQLQEEGILAAAYEGDEFKISVYMNGYVLAMAGKKWTVFAAGECGGYTYQTDDSLDPELLKGQKNSYEADEFLDLPWTVRLTMTAFDRLERNNDDTQHRLIAKHKEVSPVPRWLWGCAESAEDEFIRKEIIQEALSMLTKKQKEALGFWLDGYTQAEIAEMMAVSQSSVNERLHRSFKKLRESF